MEKREEGKKGDLRKSPREEQRGNESVGEVWKTRGRGRFRGMIERAREGAKEGGAQLTVTLLDDGLLEGVARNNERSCCTASHGC